MSEGDFDFRRPPERREPKQFQPPPWEEDAFQQLHGKKSDGEETSGDGPRAAEPEPTTAQAAAPIGSAPAPRMPASGVAPKGAEPDEALVLEMLARLRAEEPPASQSLFRVALGSSLVLFAVGGMLLIWSMAALVGSQRTGTFGVLAALTLGLFGAGFIAAGWWMIRKAIKRRGAL